MIKNVFIESLPNIWPMIVIILVIVTSLRIAYLITKHKKFLELHGFTHAIDAANNASIYYEKYINEKIVSAIRTHMFPLSLLTKYKIPNCKEGYIITLADKIITLKDFPTPNEIPKYLGIRKK